MSVVCKFTLDQKKKSEYNDEDYDITMRAVYEEDPLNDSENAKFSKYTPWGELRFGCNNPVALEQLEEGKEYYIYIKPAENDKV